jgi:hypothetical protein
MLFACDLQPALLVNYGPQESVSAGCILPILIFRATTLTTSAMFACQRRAYRAQTCSPPSLLAMLFLKSYLAVVRKEKGSLRYHLHLVICGRRLPRSALNVKHQGFVVEWERICCPSALVFLSTFALRFFVRGASIRVSIGVGYGCGCSLSGVRVRAWRSGGCSPDWARACRSWRTRWRGDWSWTGKVRRKRKMSRRVEVGPRAVCPLPTSPGWALRRRWIRPRSRRPTTRPSPALPLPLLPRLCLPEPGDALVPRLPPSPQPHHLLLREAAVAGEDGREPCC